MQVGTIELEVIECNCVSVHALVCNELYNSTKNLRKKMPTVKTKQKNTPLLQGPQAKMKEKTKRNLRV